MLSDLFKIIKSILHTIYKCGLCDDKGKLSPQAVMTPVFICLVLIPILKIKILIWGPIIAMYMILNRADGFNEGEHKGSMRILDEWRKSSYTVEALKMRKYYNKDGKNPNIIDIELN